LGAGFGCGVGARALDARGFEGTESDLEAIDHLAGAAGVDGVRAEAVDDGGESDEDAGAVLDDGQLHAGDLGIDEDAAVAAGGLLDVMVVAVIFAFERGRTAALAGWSLIVVALVVAVDVWNWLWHGVPPRVSDFRMIVQTNHLPDVRVCRIVKTKEIVFKIKKTLELWFLWSFFGRHKPVAVDSVST